MKIGQVVEEQREFFRTGKTLSYTFRDEQLQRLYAAVSTREKRFWRLCIKTFTNQTRKRI